jgi:phosphonate metabolism protein (transferase hexapeptide repeat family)
MTKLQKEGLVHEGVEAVDLRRGAYTEVGEYGHYENVDLGDYSYTGPFCFLQNTVVKKFSNIAANVRIGPTMHPMNRPTLHHFTYRRIMYGLDETDDEEFFAWRKGRIATIGHDTWIGHGAIVMPGVQIGNGAVVGSGAVVTKDVAPFAVVVGVPARLLKHRFPEALAREMEAIAWWDWPHELLHERLADFCGSAEDFVLRYGAGRHYRADESDRP